jgi:hypothetical protein
MKNGAQERPFLSLGLLDALQPTRLFSATLQRSSSSPIIISFFLNLHLIYRCCALVNGLVLLRYASSTAVRKEEEGQDCIKE